MATFHSAADASGRPVVRCCVKGAAPAVIARTTTALTGNGTIAWDSHVGDWSQDTMRRLGEAGLRVMAAGTRDLDASTFDSDGDLIAYVTDLQLTSLVGMVDPPRAESHARAARPR